MGQLHGKAVYTRAATPFLNACEKDVNKLWEAFNDVAEGFGLNQDEMCEICRSLMPTFDIHVKNEMDQLTIPLFTALDTDENGLVDALEFLGTMAVMSAMTLSQKLTCTYCFSHSGFRSRRAHVVVYNCYDFNESGQISIDELTLALRSTLTGLCKLVHSVMCPTELVLEDMALHAFHKAQKHGPDEYLTLSEFLLYAETTPEFTSWLDFFDSPLEQLEALPDEPEIEIAIAPVVNSERIARQQDPSYPMDSRIPVFMHEGIMDDMEAVPTQPWQAIVSNTTPSSPPTVNPNAPPVGLELEWIYGWNSDARHLVQYLTPTEIVYAAGSVLVIYDVMEHTQRFGWYHTDFVQCLAVNPTNRSIVASGERGRIPKLVIWSSTAIQRGGSGTPLAVIRGFHQNGLSHLAWMPNGRTLVTIGQDEYHSIAVYQWQGVEWNQPPTLVFADRGGREPIHALAVISPSLFVTSGRRHIFFWSRAADARYTTEHAVYTKRPGVLGRKTNVQTLLSLSPFPSDPNIVLAGSVRGHILVFEGRNCIRTIHAHAGAVTVLEPFPGGILSGGKDGKVRLWSKRMEPGAMFDVEALGSIHSELSSVFASPQGGAKLLMATSGAEVFEVAASDGSNLHFGAMLCGHFAHELHGLSVHPVTHEFVTSGDDRTVRVWDFKTHRQVRMTRLEAASRCITYSPDGALLAIGQGIPESEASSRLLKQLNPNKQGAFAVLNASTLAAKYEAKDSKRSIRSIAFSQDGMTLAVGSDDSFIYHYHTQDWASKGKCKARDSTLVLHQMDFSSTGEYMRATACGLHEMIYFETATGVEMTRIATLKDVEWHTTHCVYGWAVQGLWATTRGSYVELTSMDRGTFQNTPGLLAAGDALGRVRVVRYPCVAPQSVGSMGMGPASAVTRVGFTSDSAFLLATAKQERCIYQWRVEPEAQDFAAVLGGPDGITPIGNVPNMPELDYHATSDDEDERSCGPVRTTLEEAAATGSFAIDLLAQNGTTGDQVAVKSWVSCAIGPTEGPDEKDLILSTVPNENLELEWIYGYSCHHARNNVAMSRWKPQVMIYPAAHVVVVLDTKLWMQRHFKLHNDEVTALTLYSPPRSTGSKSARSTSLSEIIASGQMGTIPTIYIWKVDTLEVVQTLRGFHRHGIAELRFNSTGNLLATVGLDVQNTIGVYDWSNGILLTSIVGSACPGRILGLSFQPEEEGTSTSMLCTVGMTGITFYRMTGRQLIAKHAIMGKKGVRQPFLSVVYCHTDAIVGSTSGELYRFKGLELVLIVPAHRQGVAALYSTGPTGPANTIMIVSGGKDGCVKLWSRDLECLSEFTEFNSTQAPIRSVDWNMEENRLCIGTRSSRIYLVSSVNGQSIVPTTPDGTIVEAYEAHWKHECHGLSVCPTTDRFCTTGDDGMLRVWDRIRHVQVFSHPLETASRACAYSYDGVYIAIGLGSDVNAKRHKKDGTLLVFQDQGGSVEVVHETRDTKQSIRCIRFSPDGTSLVVASLDHNVYIYDVVNRFSKRAVFSKHKAAITHVDISMDGQYLRSCCEGYELFFADMTTGSHVASATALRNQVWDTCSTLYNWSNQGAWPIPNGVNTSLSVTASGATSSLLAIGTSHGHVNLLKYPCFVRGAGFKQYMGHHGPIAQLSFSGSSPGAHCISMGQIDRCIFQWRTTRTIDSSCESIGNSLLIKDIEPDPWIIQEGLFLPESFVNIPHIEIKPFISSMMPPTVAEPEPTDEEGPAHALISTIELQHVFGYRTYDVRNNAVYSKTKSIIYHTGCLGLQYDRRFHTQQFYTDHTRPIVSLTSSVCGSFIATGEICRENIHQEQPRIHIWEPSSCTRIATLCAFHTKAVSYLAFQHESRWLATIGQDEYHSLAVYRSTSRLWYDATLVAHTRTTRDPVYFVTCVQDTSSTPYHVVTGGWNHVLFWKMDAPTLTGIQGVFGAKGQVQPILCGGSMDSLVITGTLTGHLYVWENAVVTRAIPAHDGPVYALHTTTRGCVTGGKDGMIKVWSRTVTPLATINVHDLKPSLQQTSVRSLNWDTAEDRILIGTQGGEITELSRLTGETSLVTEAHYDVTAELVAICAHPQRSELVATAGEDSTVRVWDLNQRCVVVKATLDGPIRSLVYSPDGKWIAVGFGSGSYKAAFKASSGTNKDGTFAVLNAQTLEMIHEGRDSKQSINTIAFSPDLTLLALGGSDHCVYFYSPLDQFALRFKVTKPNGSILHMDFTADSRHLRINTDVYELMYISTLDGSVLTVPSTMKDAQWATFNCVFTWTTQGLWDFAREDEYIYSVAKARSIPLLAASTNKGEVRVYNYPVLSKQAQKYSLRGHSMHVSRVVFTSDDSRMVSIGSSDKSLLVWNIVRKK